MEALAAQRIALKLMLDSGVIERGWTFGWLSRRATARCGQCNHTTRTILLSPVFVKLNDESEIRDTILHEIAHALAGFDAGHGAEWKHVAKSLGAVPRAGARPGEVTMPESKEFRWQAQCPDCGVILRRKRINIRHANGAYVHDGCVSRLYFKRVGTPA